MNKIKRIFDEVKFFIRRKLIEKRFFKDVTFESKLHAKILKTSILTWIFALEQYKNIEIENFVFLFSEYQDKRITLPIKISRHSHHGFLNIIDGNGVTFYLTYTLDSNTLDLFTIGRKDDDFDRQFEYQLTPFGNIVPTQYWVLALNNGIDIDKSINVTFNNHTHKPNIILNNGNYRLEISLSEPNYFYTEIENYLLTLINETGFFYNILPVFVHIKNNLGYHLPITITCYKNSQISSKISTYIHYAKGELVHKYSFTEFISEKEYILHTIEFEDSVESFFQFYSTSKTS